MQLKAIPTFGVLALLALTFMPTPSETYIPAHSHTFTPPHTYVPRSTDSTIPLDSCREITAPGNYRVATNLKPGIDCFTILSSNVTLDCDGNSIEGNRFEGVGVLVKSVPARVENIEIKNCKISKHRYGIYVHAGKNISIHDNDLSRNYDDTTRSFFGKTMGWVDGGGMRIDRVEDGIVEKNIANENANGIDVREGARVLVRNNVTGWNTATGIFFWNTSRSEITSNWVNDNHRWCVLKGGEYDGWTVPGCDTAGILLQDGSSENLIAGNTLVGANGDGIYIRADGMKCGDGNQVLNNRVSSALWNAIEVGYCARTVIAGNEIANAKIGVFATFMESVEIRGNVIRNVDRYGIAVKNTSGALIARNEIAATPEGILVQWDDSNHDLFWFLRRPFDTWRSTGNVISDNRLRDLASGIHLQDSTNSRMIGNEFVNVKREYWLEGDTSGSVFQAREAGDR